MLIRRGRTPAIAALVTTLIAAASALASCAAASPEPEVALPPVAGFDYQLGGAYPPDEDVGIVARDRTDAPLEGAYSICYLNAFQTQPGELSAWPADAVLTHDGAPVRDPGWPDEALLDISSPAGREAVVERVGGWIRECAADGFDAVEFDNLDSFTRSDDALSAGDALAVATPLVEIAHAAGLAAGQKNAAEFTRLLHGEAGFDFAVSEECSAYGECTAYTEVYGEAVLNVEYTDTLPRTFAEMCADPETPHISILRDRALVTDDDPAHVREVC